MAFFECEFPRAIGFTSVGGSAWTTNVNQGFSGYEQRNRNWAQSRAMFQLHLQGKTESDFQLVYNFYLNVGGRADAWRLLWPLDYQAAAQFIATADGTVNPVYQLQKTYVTANRTYTRKIVKPIMDTVQDYTGAFLPNTVVIYDNGTPKTLGSDYTVDATTGLVQMLYTVTSGHTITADFQFHFPVRFDVDDMKNAQIIESGWGANDGSGLTTWSQIDIIEVRI